MDFVRLHAFRVFHKVREEEAFMHMELKGLFDKEKDLSSQDKAFIEAMVRNTLEHGSEIDRYISQVSKIKLHKMKPMIRSILRISVAQLLFMDRIPDHAVCNEAQELCKKLKLMGLKGFVNGVLRSIIRLRDSGFDPFKDMDKNSALFAKYSIPDWMGELFLKDLGFERTEAFLKALTEPVRLSAYRNKLKIAKEALKDFEALPYELDGVYLKSADDPLIKNGSLLVQDVSSMLEGKVVDARKGQVIIDVCAAPGGKSFHAAIDMEGEGLVISRDQNEKKKKLLLENAKRLGIETIDIGVQDARVLDPSLIERADVVIADLPCSGLGIMGRKPDIRYHTKMEDVKALSSLQEEILRTVTRYVKPGGRLVYSTCTLASLEDEFIYDKLLAMEGFERESLVPYLKGVADDESLLKGYIKLLPGEGPFDGFFIGSVRKRG